MKKNEVLPKHLGADVPAVRSEVSQPTYGLELGLTVHSVTRDFIFTSRLIALVFLILGLFW